MSKYNSRFWSKVDKNGPIPKHCPELGRCWVWTGATNKYGYGRLTVEKIWWASHRYIYTTLINEIPKGMYVLHKCDNPPCVKPSHLFLGTHKINMADMADKGRWNGAILIGESNGRSVITSELVIRARLLALSIGCRPAARQLSKETGVSENTLKQAIRRVTWRHL